VARTTRTSLTLGALLLLGQAALIRAKPKEDAPKRLPLDAWVERTEILPPPQEGSKAPQGGWKPRLGKVLIVLGLLFVGYTAAILLWRDPATDLYARWKQHQLAGQFEKLLAAYSATVSILPPADERPKVVTDQEIADYQRERIEAAANNLNRHLKMGKPLGRLTVPRMGLRTVVVQGTRWGPDLSRGPGHYPQSSLAGVGRTMAIAGHRTTFGAPFRHIDSLKAGDRIRLRLPYATFYYRVIRHTVVSSGDWHVIRDRGFDTLVLSACHPLYSASHRWVVFAALVRVDPVKGIPYLVDRRNRVRPLHS
jgi:sortase A